MRAIDLCCGLGGWAEGLIAVGYEVIGFDIVRRPTYPGRMVIADVRTLDGRRFTGFDLIVASPPCEEFSRHDQPQLRAKNPPPPDLSLVDACRRIAAEAGAPLVMENVRGAQKFIGRAEWRWGSCYLWGDGVPVLRRWTKQGNGKVQINGRNRALLRAKIPFELALYIGEYHRGWSSPPIPANHG